MDMTYIRRSSISAVILLIGSSACDHADVTQRHHADGGSRSLALEAAAQQVRRNDPGMNDDCLQKIISGKPVPSGVDKCFAMLPAQRWRGLWRDDFEGSRFCPAPAAVCADDTPGDKIWLSFDSDVRPDGGRKPTMQLYSIEFIGRRTRERGSYGHMGTSQHEVLVDTLVATKPLSERSRQ